MSAPDPEFLFERVLPDGRWVTLSPMAFGNTRLCVSPYRGCMTYDDGY